MYATIREKSDNGAVRKYATTNTAKSMPKSITKKGSFLDLLLKGDISPGPASNDIFYSRQIKSTGGLESERRNPSEAFRKKNLHHRNSAFPSKNKFTVTKSICDIDGLA